MSPAKPKKKDISSPSNFIHKVATIIYIQGRVFLAKCYKVNAFCGRKK